MATEDFVPKTNKQIEQWLVHVEAVLRGQANSYKPDSVQHYDRNYIADGINFIRMRDFPRKITLPEAVSLDDKLKEVGIPREWFLKQFKINRYGEMYESEQKMVFDTIQTWFNLYKKSLERTNEKGQTLQDALVEEANKVKEGLPKGFLDYERNRNVPVKTT